ncbi:MAG: flagellar basal body protein, partial [Pseudooceanicola nanhaiensis]
MSLASALNSARSGLSYTSRWAQTTSTNISNANTLGYARRTPQLATSTMGDPVITGISR